MYPRLCLVALGSSRDFLIESLWFITVILSHLHENTVYLQARSGHDLPHWYESSFPKQKYHVKLIYYVICEVTNDFYMQAFFCLWKTFLLQFL